MIWGGEGDAGEGGQLERRLLLDQEGKGRQMLTLPRWLLGGLQLTAAVEPLLMHHGDGGDIFFCDKTSPQVFCIFTNLGP